MVEALAPISLDEERRTVTISHLIIDDPDVYELILNTPETQREDMMKRAIVLGVMAVRRALTGGEVDYVEKEFQRMQQEMTAHVDSMFDLKDENSPLGKLVASLGNYFDENGKVQQLLDPYTENTPIYKLKKAILDEFKLLRDALVEKKKEEEVIGITPLKGYVFEVECEELLNDIARHFGDRTERTSTTIGLVTASKAGDFVATLSERPDLKIALQVKDWDNVTFPQVQDELTRAMENRGAQYSIFVIKNKEALPKYVGWFNEYSGNQLVCALGTKEDENLHEEILEIAYKWARAKLLLREAEVKGIDTTKLQESMDEISKSLRKFSNIRTKCTNIETSVGEIRDILKGIEEEINEQLNLIQQEITAQLQSVD
ncbi:MAG: hypothetical protein WBC82_08920 [Dehalococcoidia bacterium]